MPKLILPAGNFKKTFLDFIDELVHEKSWYGPAPADIKADFEAHIERLRDHRAGRNLPEGRVPCTEYWIMDHGKVVGRILVRHRLTPDLERLGGHIGYEIRPAFRKRGFGSYALAAVLPFAAKLPMTRALLTCAENNDASIKIIEGNGGVLGDAIKNPERDVRTRRYWIDLTPWKA